MTTKYAAKISFRADESFDEGGKIDTSCARPTSRRTSELAPKANDRTRRRDGRRRCRAEPFAEAHREALRAACAEDREIWAIYANDFGPAGFDASIDSYTANPRNARFVLFDGDELAGMSSFLGLDEGRGRCVEIGGTYYRPHLRGTGLNRRVKDMMLARAFERGIRRVEFRVDVRNQRSQAAMAKLGAVREGVLRADRITWTGHVRDTVLFSILRTSGGRLLIALASPHMPASCPSPCSPARRPARRQGPRRRAPARPGYSRIERGQPAKARRVAADRKPRPGEIQVSVRAMMGTTMTISSNNKRRLHLPRRT